MVAADQPTARQENRGFGFHGIGKKYGFRFQFGNRPTTTGNWSVIS